jgi:hypothetical protein
MTKIWIIGSGLTGSDDKFAENILGILSIIPNKDCRGGISSMGTCADFKCKCGYEAFGKWGIGMNPIYREQNISLAPPFVRIAGSWSTSMKRRSAQMP